MEGKIIHDKRKGMLWWRKPSRLEHAGIMACVTYELDPKMGRAYVDMMRDIFCRCSF